jgi:hypothetical protein
VCPVIGTVLLLLLGAPIIASTVLAGALAVVHWFRAWAGPEYEDDGRPAVAVVFQWLCPRCGDRGQPTFSWAIDQRGLAEHERLCSFYATARAKAGAP